MSLPSHSAAPSSSSSSSFFSPLSYTDNQHQPHPPTSHTVPPPSSAFLGPAATAFDPRPTFPTSPSAEYFSFHHLHPNYNHQKQPEHRPTQRHGGTPNGGSDGSITTLIGTPPVVYSLRPPPTDPPPNSSNSNENLPGNPQGLNLQRLPPRTPAEYTLHTLFSEFVKAAEEKLTGIMDMQLDKEPDITAFLGPGVDPSFDTLLKSLGSIAHHRPKPVIDSVMLWRKSKSEAPAKLALQKNLTENPAFAKFRDAPGIVNERISLVSIYILCRALIEIVKQLRPDILSEDLGERLEEIVFNQLKTADPDSISRSPNRQANMNLFAELIGWLSNIRFASVSDRFIAELEKAGPGMPSLRENIVEMIIKGMRYLKLKIYPQDALEETADFLQSLARFFKTSESIKIRHAYAELFVELLTPIGAVAVAEVNFPAWTKSVDLIYPKASKMSSKPRHWHIAYPLVTTLLCVSKRDFFLANWLQFVELCFQKFKDKGFRNMALACVSRLMWVYVYRCPDSGSNLYKKLDSVLKVLFPPNRRHVAPPDVPPDHFIQILHFIGTRHFDYVLKNHICSVWNTENLTVDTMQPERMVIALRTFMLLIHDMERGETKPPFPVKTEGAVFPVPCLDPISPAIAVRPGMKEALEKMNDALGKSLLLLEHGYGGLLLSDERYLSSRGLFAAAGASLASFTSFTAAASNAGIIGGGSSTTSIGSNSGDASNRDNQAPPTSASSTSTYTVSKEKQGFLDLMKTCIDTLPRLSPSNVPLAQLVDILSRYTIHIDPELAKSSALALIRLAKHHGAQTVVIGFARFVHRLEDRFAELLALSGTVEGGLLKVHVELLEIWAAELERKVSGENRMSVRASKMESFDGRGGTGNLPRAPNSKAGDSEQAHLWNIIEETESNGLLFLCSHMPPVRRYAMQILKLAADLGSKLEQQRSGAPRYRRTLLSMAPYNPANVPDAMGALGRPEGYSRIIRIVEGEGAGLVDANLADAEGSRLAEQQRVQQQRQHLQRPAKVALSHMAESDELSDAAVWWKCFPDFVKLCFEYCPLTVALCRQYITRRILQLHSVILATAESAGSNSRPSNSLPGKWTSKSSPAGDVLVEQWRAYLIFGCITITVAEDPTSSGAGYFRKRSVPMERIASARDLFRMVLPLLSCEHLFIRESVVAALGRINKNSYRVLLEDMQPLAKSVLDDLKAKSGMKGQGKRNKRMDRLRGEIAHIYQLTADFLTSEPYSSDSNLISMLMAYVKETKIFLSDQEVQLEWDHQKLRQHFCGLVERLSECISRHEDPSRLLSFEARVGLFKMFEEWCGHGQHGSSTREREAKMMLSVLDQYKDMRERGAMTSALEEERKNLELAALRAMAALCRGPVMASIGRDRKAMLSFDVHALFQWIDSVFGSPDGRLHSIARTALEALLLFNREHLMLLDDVIHQAYVGNPAMKFTQGYFSALADILIRENDYPCPAHKTLSLVVFKVGDPFVEIRRHAVQLLQYMETRFFGESCASDYEIAIVSELPTIHRQAQTVLSARLARDHVELTYEVVCEVVSRTESVNPTIVRDMLAYLVPWLRNVELAMDPAGTELRPASYVMLTNLFFLTVKYGDQLVKEIESLWSHLVVAGKVRNVRAVIFYLLNLGLAKRNPAFVQHAKKVVVYLGRTSACPQLVEELIAEITPRSLVPQVKVRERRPSMSAHPHLYMANIDDVLVAYPKRPAFSRGQLALVMLADLAIEAGDELREHLPLLLHVIFVQLDHFTTLIGDHTRLLLINLVHSIIVRESNNALALERARALIERLSAFQDGQKLWAYEDITCDDREIESPAHMDVYVKWVVDIFTSEDAELRQRWGETSVKWATSCPVRHAACRSFQIFRSLMPNFNQLMVADMLARLSNTISDTSEEIQAFALEILITLNVMVESLDDSKVLMFPQIFWAVTACLHSPHEQEYMESLYTIENILYRTNLDDPAVIDTLLGMFPEAWRGQFVGLQPLLMQGFRSATAEPIVYQIVNRLITVQNDGLVDNGGGRLLFSMLANVPRLLEGLQQTPTPEDCLAVANDLCTLAERFEHANAVRLLSAYWKGRFRKEDDLVRQLTLLLRESYFAEFEGEIILFLMCLLSNKIPLYKLKTLKILKALLPHVDPNRSQLVGAGSELVAPLLRLLNTEFAKEALEVLDEAMRISAGQPDGRRPSFAVKAMTSRVSYIGGAATYGGQVEEESTQVHSPPRGSGWFVLHPMTAARTTRHNVNAVVYTCATTTGETAENVRIEFSTEEAQGSGPNLAVSDMARSQSIGPESSRLQESDEGLSFMVSALDDLDAFFTTCGENEAPA